MALKIGKDTKTAWPNGTIRVFQTPILYRIDTVGLKTHGYS